MVQITHPSLCGSQRGSALLVSLAILVLVSLLAITSVETSRVEMNIAGNDVRRNQALLIAEAGLAQTDAVLHALPKQQNADTLMKFINAASQLPNATFNVAMESGIPFRKVISIGRGFESEAAIQVTYHYAPSPYNIWNNVIFAGHGQNGMSIQGNTSIHGSVHILGDGEPYQDLNGDGDRDPGEPYTDANHDGAYDGPLPPGTPALAISGTALIGNNYTGMQPVLSSRVPALPTMPYGGEDVQTLFAELRVKHGQVILDGGAQAGQPNVAGGSPAIKETMDAAWVTDGFGGSGGEGAVYTDNGYEDSYDFADEGPAMPNLDDPYVDKNGVSHSTYMSYLKSNALVISGDLQIKCGATLPVVSNAAGMITMDHLGNLTGSGVIYVRGDVRIIGKCPVSYKGRFTLVSEGNTTIDTDFYPKGTFATQDVAGVVSHGKLVLGDQASQLRLAGAFFAQEEVRTTKQTQLAGTIVSNYFDLDQVPDLYQVPLLAANLPPAMPGADDFYMYSWRRVPKSWTELY